MVGSGTRQRVRLAALLVLVAALAAAGCSGKKSTSTGGTAAAGNPLFQKLPASIQKAKEIKVGSDIEYAPIEFFKEGTQQVQGLDWDLAQALGAKLGVKMTFVNDTDFANIITALRAGRFDIIMSAMNDNSERRGKGVDFIDYFTAGTSIIVKKGNPQGVHSYSDLCGKTIAVQSGTTQDQTTIPEQDKKCTAAGKPKINTLRFEKDTDALLQVKSGRAVADLEDFPVAAYNAKTSGGGNDFEVVGQQVDTGTYGIAVPRDNTQLRDALQAALKAVVNDGTYDQILNKWGVGQGALKTATLNAGS
jgi:polar amino acid transport system substrate-binding protein